MEALDSSLAAHFDGYRLCPRNASEFYCVFVSANDNLSCA